MVVVVIGGLLLPLSQGIHLAHFQCGMNLTPL